MTVFRKLQAARLGLLESGIKKSGKNSFHGWSYYELGDFIPTVHKLFDAVGLCGVVTFGLDVATLTVYDSEDGKSIQFSTPIVHAENNKAQAIQNLGSTHTYLRRYLWLLAMEIVEADAVDALPQEEKPKAKPEPKLALKPSTKPPAVIEGKGGQWTIHITTDPSATVDQWAVTAYDATILALEQAKSLDDVMTIFRVNRNIFDRLQADAQAKYKELIAKFTQFKEKFSDGSIPQ